MDEQKLIVRNFKGIIDSTLREGFQFSKADFSREEQRTIFSYLCRIGVDYIEVGNPAREEIEDMIIALLRSRNGYPAKVLSHIRNHESDLDKALACGVSGVNILCTADPERLAALGLTESEYLRRLEENIVRAQREGLEVRASVEDFFSRPDETSRRIYGLADRLCVQRIGLADTLGKAMNWDVYQKIQELRRSLSVDFEVHLHNDLGHAVSNALAALVAGANWIDTTLVGIGERTGITPLSSLLVNLYLNDPAIISRYNLGVLTAAENYVSRICNIETPINLITNRSNGFAHKAGIHLNALMHFGPQKYEPFPPKLVGNKRTFVLNSVISGKTTAADVKKFNRRFGERKEARACS